MKKIICRRRIIAGVQEFDTKKSLNYHILNFLNFLNFQIILIENDILTFFNAYFLLFILIVKYLCILLIKSFKKLMYMFI